MEAAIANFLRETGHPVRAAGPIRDRARQYLRDAQAQSTATLLQVVEQSDIALHETDSVMTRAILRLEIAIIGIVLRHRSRMASIQGGRLYSGRLASSSRHVLGNRH